MIRKFIFPRQSRSVRCSDELDTEDNRTRPAHIREYQIQSISDVNPAKNDNEYKLL